MNELQESLGRDLTDNQKGELMDIVGEYSPMEDGKYTAYMSLEKAHGIWQKGQGNAGKHEMARIAGTQSQGSSNTVSLERPQWGDWRKKYTELA